MAFFKVSFDVAPVEMMIDDTYARYGFLTNIYVWSATKSGAIYLAKPRLIAALERRAREGGVDFSNAELKVESVECSNQYWKLLRPEGFVFYRQDELD